MSNAIYEYTFDNSNEFLDQLLLRTKLIENNTHNTGDKTVILASSAPSLGGEFSIGEHMYGKYVSQYFKNSSRIHEIFSMNPKNISIKLQATANDLYDVLHDKSVENIVLVGHANYNSWSSRSGSVDAYDISLKATDHLKKGYFINAGCALITNDMFFPLGSFCVSDWKKLGGAQKGRRMGFDDIKKHKFYSHPVYLDEYLIYYEMMGDDIYDILMEEYKYLANFENSKNNIVSHTKNKKDAL